LMAAPLDFVPDNVVNTKDGTGSSKKYPTHWIDLVKGMLVMKRTHAVVFAPVFVLLLVLAAGCGVSKPVVKSVAPKTGFPGTGFKIAGTDFGTAKGKSTVRMGSKTLTTSSWSATGIATGVPKDMTAGNYSVTVTTSGGTSNKVAFTVEPSFTGSSPLPAMMNYLKSKSVDTNGLSFTVVTTSKSDPNWKLDKATRASQDTSYFLFHKESGGWAIVDYGTDLSADQLKLDGAPSDIPAAKPAGSSSSSPTSSPASK